MNFDILSEQLREVCEWANCPLPRADLPDEVGKQTQVDMARVFVMPRVVAQEALPKEPKPISTAKLISGRKGPRRLVILGGPGSGKTTLLEALTVAFVKPERVRDLEKDLEKHNSLWDCIQFRCSRAMSAALPLGFFPRQMECGGLAGNIWAWTESLLSEGREERVVRGGSWHNDEDYASCADRNGYDPEYRGSRIGFRCAKT